MENFPTFLVTFNVCAATFPRFASAMGVVWVLGRVMYQLGYQKVGPKGRGRGSIFANLAALGLVSSCCSIVLMVAWRWNLRCRCRVLEVHVTQRLYAKDLVLKMYVHENSSRKSNMYLDSF